MAAEPLWSRLSDPSAVALRWAWASGIAAGGGRGPDDVSVGSLDLLAGILLTHVADSEPR
ncbi:MAG: hypothetical protein ACRD0K_24210 [Egibacteraceae bacterium]